MKSNKNNKQAGAELCQAQLMLERAKLATLALDDIALVVLDYHFYWIAESKINLTSLKELCICLNRLLGL